MALRDEWNVEFMCKNVCREMMFLVSISHRNLWATATKSLCICTMYQLHNYNYFIEQCWYFYSSKMQTSSYLKQHEHKNPINFLHYFLLISADCLLWGHTLSDRIWNSRIKKSGWNLEIPTLPIIGAWSWFWRKMVFK